MKYFDFRDRCDTCGRFVNANAPGVSWCQTYSYDMSGMPTLDDPTNRCSPCTDRLGVKPTNCHGDGYNGRNGRPGTEGAPVTLAQPCGASEPHGGARGQIEPQDPISHD